MSRLTRSQQGDLTPAGEFSRRRQDGSRLGVKSQSVSSKIDLDKTYTNVNYFNRSSSRSSSISSPNALVQQRELPESNNLQGQGIRGDILNSSSIHPQSSTQALESGRNPFSNKQLESNRHPESEKEEPQKERLQTSGSSSTRARIQPRQEETQIQTQDKGKGVEGFNLWRINQSQQEFAGNLSTSGEREEEESLQTRESRGSRGSRGVNLIIDSLQSHFNNIEKLIVDNSTVINDKLDLNSMNELIKNKFEQLLNKINGDQLRMSANTYDIKKIERDLKNSINKFITDSDDIKKISSVSANKMDQLFETFYTLYDQKKSLVGATESEILSANKPQSDSISDRNYFEIYFLSIRVRMKI